MENKEPQTTEEKDLITDEKIERLASEHVGGNTSIVWILIAIGVVLGVVFKKPIIIPAIIAVAIVVAVFKAVNRFTKKSK